MSAPEAEWNPMLGSLLEHMRKTEASDLYLTAASPPVFRIEGIGYPARHPLTAEQIAALAESLLTPPQRDELRRAFELNLALAPAAGGRFRANLMQQRGTVAMVIRQVRTTIPSLAELGHPPILGEIMQRKRGLVLVVGGTDTGKSTTLAAMIDHRNRLETGHIITIEDPIEFIHPNHQCVVTQREIGIDTLSYRDALRNALRQTPDVILIGEIRDTETMEAALAFGETGHLCVSTLHANNANQAIERVLNFFPHERQHEIRLQLSLNLRAIVSQRLIPAIAGGRATALEILLDTPRIRDLIKRGEIDTLKDAMAQGTHEGCATFDAALFALVTSGRICEAEAIKAADSPNNLRIQLDHRRNATGAPGLKEPPLRLVAEPKAPQLRTS